MIFQSVGENRTARLTNYREYECHLRGYSPPASLCIVYAKQTRCRHQYARCAASASAPQPRKRAKKIESKPGGGSIACKRVQRYCMQSSHLQVSIPWMYLCAVYLSLRLQSAAPTLKGERWQDARKEGLVLSAAMPRDLLRGDRSSRGARPRG